MEGREAPKEAPAVKEEVARGGEDEARIPPLYRYVGQHTPSLDESASPKLHIFF
jgi:hypothetical protein